MNSKRFWNRFSQRQRGSSQAKPAGKRGFRSSRIEALESRQMLSVNLGPLNNIQVPGGKSVLVPLTGLDSNNGSLSYSFQSSDSNVTLSLVSPNSKSLQLNVSGTDKNNQAFTGTLILHLFEDLTPVATARIEQLAGQGLYNDKHFFRVLDGFVAQNDGSSGQNFDNEIVPSLTFNSPGLLAMANAGSQSGHGTNDAQFFITGIDGKGTTDPITLARMPQFLNGNYTLFGQLVSGFDTFEKIMSAPVQASQTFNGEVSSPIHTITITSAQIIDDRHDAVLRVSAPASFDGHSATITVTATNASNETAHQAFAAAAVVNPPYLNPVSNQSTTATTPVMLTLTSNTNDATAGKVYKLFDAATLGTPAHVTVSINQTTGQVTLTPTAGFTGPINLLAGVRATAAADSTDSYDTLPFTLTVTPNTALNPTLDALSNQTTTAGAQAMFTLTSSDPGGNGVIYKIADASTFGNPANATVDINQATGHITLTPAAGFTGTINLLAAVRSASAADTQANYNTKAFTLTVNSATTANPTLGAVSNQTTTAGAPVMFTLTSTDPSAAGIFYKVADPITFGTPANAIVSINQTTGQVTLTPTAGFTGTINLLAGVRASSATDVQASYNTKPFTLTVSAAGTTPVAPTGLSVDSSSNTGTFDGDGYLSHGTPKLKVTAVTGGTVKLKLNGTVIATATETATGSGQFSATIPAGKLAIGSNAITATVTTADGTSVDSTAMSVIYAPSYSGVYTVPGLPGTAQHLNISWTSRRAKYDDEIGYFIVNSLDGTIGGVVPGSAGYARASIGSSTSHVLFAKGQKAGANATINTKGGQLIVFYMIQNNTTANFHSKNASDALHGNNNARSPLAFFSVAAANPDGKKHAQVIADPTTGRVEYNWEDLLSIGDRDFNDVVMTVRLAGQSARPPATVHTPGTGDRTVTLNGSLHAARHHSTAGDLGVYFVDNPDGSIGTLKPGDSGYAAAALASTNSRVLFAAGSPAGGRHHVTVPAGKYLAFYLISHGTTTNFLTANPTNKSRGSAVALFSFDSANPAKINHFRWYTPGQSATDPTALQLHIMDKVFGKGSDFDDLTMGIDFTA